MATTNAGQTQWLSSEEAARRLGVKLGTLYSYVSRGVVRSIAGPDGRSSRFDRADIEAMLTRRRSNPGGGAETVLASAITRLSEDGVQYRGRSVDDLARTHTFEEVASLLWQVEPAPTPWPVAPLDLPSTPQGSLSDRLRIAVALAATSDPHRHDLRPASVVVSARRLVASAVEALPLTCSPAPALVVGERRVDGSIAAALAARLGGPRPSRATVSAVNTALVLLADHELATSTYAARVAASTRADVYSAVLAGAACNGPLHMGAGRDAGLLLRDSAERGAAEAVGDWLRSGRPLPGFGHKIYRADPRFTRLFAVVEAAGFPQARIALVREVLALAAGRIPVPPNIDTALAALAYCADFHLDATEAIFVVARMAGWVAHALEEYGEAPLRFRTRGLYVGPRDG